MKKEKNEFEYYVPYEIKDLDSFKLVESTNKVLIQIDNTEVEETVGGLITKGVKEHAIAKNTVRSGKVVKTCKSFIPGRNAPDYTVWQTDIQIKEGDVVYLNHFDMNNSFDFYHGDMILKLIPYTSVVCAKRDGKVIMCNGYVLLEDVEVEVKLLDYSKKEKVLNQGIIRYLGKPNDRYYKVVFSHHINKFHNQGKTGREVYAKIDRHCLVRDRQQADSPQGILKEGQKVMIDDPRRCFYLEEYAYARFDNRKLYRVCQQRNIVAIIG